MFYGKTIETAIVTNLINKCQQLKPRAVNLTKETNLIERNEETEDKTMVKK